jgi:hypothetical protein
MCWLTSLSPILGLVGVVIGWGLTVVSRRWEEKLFGTKLVIDGGKAPGRKTETGDKVYMRIRVQNTTERRIAKEL